MKKKGIIIDQAKIYRAMDLNATVVKTLQDGKEIFLGKEKRRNGLNWFQLKEEGNSEENYVLSDDVFVWQYITFNEAGNHFSTERFGEGTKTELLKDDLLIVVAPDDASGDIPVMDLMGQRGFLSNQVKFEELESSFRLNGAILIFIYGIIMTFIKAFSADSFWSGLGAFFGYLLLTIVDIVAFMYLFKFVRGVIYRIRMRF